MLILICASVAAAYCFWGRLRLTKKSALEIINSVSEAIASGRDVRIRYEKEDGTVTGRTVTPRELRKLSILELQDLIGNDVEIRKEGRLCIFGYCHLRGANRVFAVDRIQALRLIAR